MLLHFCLFSSLLPCQLPPVKRKKFCVGYTPFARTVYNLCIIKIYLYMDSSYSLGVVFTMSFTLTHSFSRQLVPRLPCCCSDSCRWCCYGGAVARRQTFPRMWRQSSRSDCTTSSRSRGERRTSSSHPWAWLWLWAWWSWAPAALL